MNIIKICQEHQTVAINDIKGIGFIQHALKEDCVYCQNEVKKEKEVISEDEYGMLVSMYGQQFVNDRYEVKKQQFVDSWKLTYVTNINGVEKTITMENLTREECEIVYGNMYDEELKMWRMEKM